MAGHFAHKFPQPCRRVHPLTTRAFILFGLFCTFAPDALKSRKPPDRFQGNDRKCWRALTDLGAVVCGHSLGSSRMRAFAGARTFVLGVSLSAAGLAGCQTPDPSPRPAYPVSDLPRGTPLTLKNDAVGTVAMTSSPGAVGPTEVVTQVGGTTPGEFPVAADAVAASGAPLTVADLERLALAHNPTLVQAAAFVDAARGKATQAGLPFNPLIGMTAEQIGAGNTAGEVRWFTLQQQIVTGGKLRLSRLKYQQEAELAEIQASAQRLQVVNGIASAYFGVLAAQRSVENHKRLLGERRGRR